MDLPLVELAQLRLDQLRLRLLPPDVGDGATQLHAAASVNADTLALQLLRTGADVHAADAWRMTPLHEASGTEVTHILLAHGARIDTRADGGITPLHAAAIRGCALVVRALLNCGADAAARTDDGLTVLHLAADAGSADTVELLLGMGSAASARAPGLTPLHCAARGGCVHAVTALLRAGASVNERTGCGKTPLHFAGRAKSGGAACAAALLAASSCDDAVHAHDAQGWTALHAAAACDARDMVSVLLAVGADAGARTHGGMVPRDLAKQRATRRLLHGYRKSATAAACNALQDVSVRWVLGAILAGTWRLGDIALSEQQAAQAAAASAAAHADASVQAWCTTAWRSA
jgi:cytohesin